MRKKPSEAQEYVLDMLRMRGEHGREDFYARGVRMQTVRSLCRMGLVVARDCRDDYGRLTGTVYGLAPQQKAVQ